MSKNHTPGARRVVPRSRGALSGFALIVLGLWGALIPFIGPYFNFSFTPDDAWHWTSARGWLEVLPGAATFVAGFSLLVSKSRTMTLVAAWLGIAAGAWFAVGPQLQDVWNIGSPGQPAGSGEGVRALEVLALFTLLGVVIVYFAATAFGRLSVVSLRDAHAAERREAAAAAEAEREREAAAARDREDAAAREREAAEAAAAHERTAAGHDDARGGDVVRNDAVANDRIVNDRDANDRAHSATVREADANRNNVPVAAATPATKDADGSGRHGTNGSHAVKPDSGQQTQPQPQQTQPQPQPQTQPQPQPTYAQAPQTGYAQPQQYDPQHGYAQPASAAQPDESDTEHESIARRLFHRR